MKTANIIADQLFKVGVRHVYGIPGGASIPWIEAFRNKGIDFVLVSNEASAGVMAAVTARLTGVPGVCHATFGPGATNISTGTGCAFLDRDPVIVLTSEMNDAMKARTAQICYKSYIQDQPFQRRRLDKKSLENMQGRVSGSCSPWTSR
ncbi:MAG: thiamine pyrophosphate-binding protein [Bacteroidales bacterium]|nr:thiamine pyrophosphate-binding protein [Bacteroidales bacterium]